MPKAKEKTGEGATGNPGLGDEQTEQGGGHEQYDPQAVADAILEARGNILVAATMLGCSRTTVYRYVEVYEEVKQAIVDARERALDYVENKMFKRIDHDDGAMIRFYLREQGQSRGYGVNRYEHSGPGGGPIPTESTVIVLPANGSEAPSKGGDSMLADDGQVVE